MEKEEPSSASADESVSTTTTRSRSSSHTSMTRENHIIPNIEDDSQMETTVIESKKRLGSVAFPFSSSSSSSFHNHDNFHDHIHSNSQMIPPSILSSSSSSSTPAAAATTTESGSESGFTKPGLTPLKRDGKDLTEKKIRRLEKNRLSARNCRRKKKEYTQNLQHEINVLEGENLKLRLQLQIGREAELNVLEEQSRVTEELDALLKSGASDSDVFESIEEFKERFADYGRDRRSAIEYHLRNVERLLMPTTTTSVAIRALQGGMVGNSSSSSSMMMMMNQAGGTMSSQMNIVPTNTLMPMQDPLSTTPQEPSASVSQPQRNEDNHPVPTNTMSTHHTSQEDVSKMDPKNMFQYLVNFLNVTPEQASVLRDSRFVAKELDSALAQALSTLQQLRDRLSTIGQDLEHEFSEIRSILTSRQSAKFLVWVANNAPAMHMLNEVWSGIHSVPTLHEGSSEDDPSNSDVV